MEEWNLISEQVLNFAGSIIIAIDLDGFFLYMNEYGLNFFGFSPQEIVGKHLVGTIVPAVGSDGSDLKAFCASVFEDPDAHLIIENENISKNGERFWISWSSRKVYFSELQREVIISVGADFTEKRRLEKQVESQQRIAIRNNRLRSIGEMAGGMAHEFNQPLAIIRGAAENILIGKERGWPIDDNELMTRMTRIIEQTERMSKLIEHVRSLSRHADTDDNCIFSIPVVIESALSLVRAQLASRGIDLNMGYMSEELWAQGNPFSLEEALLVILYNARDAIERVEADTSANRKYVEISLSVEQTETGAMARIGIQDSGEGISSEVHEHLFEPFFTTKDPDSGTGLGLASAKSIVEAMGGRIDVDIDLPLGCIFYIWLPVYVKKDGDE